MVHTKQQHCPSRTTDMSAIPLAMCNAHILGGDVNCIIDDVIGCEIAGVPGQYMHVHMCHSLTCRRAILQGTPTSSTESAQAVQLCSKYKTLCPASAQHEQAVARLTGRLLELLTKCKQPSTPNQCQVVMVICTGE